MPDNFYSTTNNHTQDFSQKKWITSRKYDDGQMYCCKRKQEHFVFQLEM